jgi:hypothetical protein
MNGKYQPEWRRLKITPKRVDLSTEDYNGDIMENLKRNRGYQDLKKKTAEVRVMPDDSDLPQIKLSANMAPVTAGMWYSNDKIDPTRVVDNNDDYDYESLQIDNSNSVISQIKQKYTKELEQTVPQQNKNFVLLLKRKPILIGTLDEVKEKAKDIILQVDDLRDEDVMVFMRIPLEKIFG